ncbi:Germin-like protein [Rhynchospora pubera]|uniref:Germin-like protein n=1 Tax=Rhynchospora pubera TaxID=906938 RepID=A0AAV8HJ97_9POAL|nr:Germin-like protein [Rhynchospora pubera]
MAAARISLLIVLFALSFSFSLGYNLIPLQYLCVADKTSQVFVLGGACKDPNRATANYFYFDGLDYPGNTSNELGSAVLNLVNVKINTQELNINGISIARIDYAVWP